METGGTPVLRHCPAEHVLTEGRDGGFERGQGRDGPELNLQRVAERLQHGLEARTADVDFLRQTAGLEQGIRQTASGRLAIRRLQLTGRRAMSARDFASGQRGLIGTVLGT